jgi:hypothetical protein
LASPEPRTSRRILGFVDDGVLLVLVVLVFPLIILAAGGAIGLLVHVIREIAYRVAG